MPSAQLDDDSLRRALPLARDLTASDVETIGKIAFLTAEIDFDEDLEESSFLDALNRTLWTSVGEPVRSIPVISPLPLDREERMRWIHELVPQLTSEHARELAYATAYLVVVVDQELEPLESALLVELQHALAIDDERAAELAEHAALTITPSDDDDEPVRTMHRS